MSRAPDVAVVGAGIVGAACALFLTRSGARVELLEQAFPGAGSTGACEGNVLAWDKELERELPLALRSAALWQRAGRASSSATSSTSARAASSSPRREAELRAARERARVLAGARRGQGEAARRRRAAPTRSRYAAHDLPGGVLYPGDAQLEPRLATAALVRARSGGTGAALCDRTSRCEGIEPRGSGRAIAASGHERGAIAGGAVVVAAGVWTAHAAGALRPAGAGHAPQGPDRRARALAASCSGASSARPATVGRRGGRTSAADRDGGGVDAVGHDAAGLQPRSTSASTASVDVASRGAIARRAARFFPILTRRPRAARLRGLRPLTPDHIPIIGPFAERRTSASPPATRARASGSRRPPASSSRRGTRARRPPALAWFSPDRFAPVGGRADAIGSWSTASRSRRRQGTRSGPCCSCAAFASCATARPAARAASTAGSASARSAACASRAAARCARA